MLNNQENNNIYGFRSSNICPSITSQIDSLENVPKNGIFKYVIMAKDANCSSQSAQSDFLLFSTIAWKYIQDDELVWKLNVEKISFEGTIDFELNYLGCQLTQFLLVDSNHHWLLEKNDSQYIKNGSLLFSEMDKTLKSLDFDMELIKGYIINNIADIQNTITKLFVIDQMINHDEFQPLMGNGITLEASSLLLNQYKCPNDWLQCPSSGDCIDKEKQCDGYADCTEGLDEDPKQIIINCCDEFILREVDTLSELRFLKYIGTYEKVDGIRYQFLFVITLLRGDAKKTGLSMFFYG